MHTCHLCSYITKLKKHLVNHLANMHDVNVTWHYCDLCDYKAKHKTGIKSHKANIHGIDVKWVFCDLCDYKTKQSGHYHEHRRIKHDVNAKWYYCVYCDFHTKIIKSWKEHMVRCHTPDEDISWIPCADCSMTFITRTDLISHRKRKHEITFIPCPESNCSYQGKTKDDMKLHHINCHATKDEIQWFACQQCDYKAKQSSHLRTHMADKHNVAVKWYPCTRCDFKTKQNSALTAHMKRKHTICNIGVHKILQHQVVLLAKDLFFSEKPNKILHTYKRRQTIFKQV